MKEKVILDEYYSKANAFLLPLTGLKRELPLEVTAYLYWGKYSIENYQLIISVSYDNEEEYMDFVKTILFPTLDKKGYLIENYDIQGRGIFILDISEYAFDIQLFLDGQYSKFSKELKDIILRYHSFEKTNVQFHIWAALNPNVKKDKLGGKSPIEYVSKEYQLDLDEMLKVGEIGSKFDRDKETLLTDIDEICQVVRETE